MNYKIEQPYKPYPSDMFDPRWTWYKILEDDNIIAYFEDEEEATIFLKLKEAILND